MTKISPLLAEKIQKFNDFMDEKYTEGVRNLEEITKGEINDLISNPSNESLYYYIYAKFLDLKDLIKNPETFTVCIKLFNQILESIIENEETKKLLLSGKEKSKMFTIREDILKSFSSFLDKKVVKLLKKHTQFKEEESEFPEEDEI